MLLGAACLAQLLPWAEAAGSELAAASGPRAADAEIAATETAAAPGIAPSEDRGGAELNRDDLAVAEPNAAEAGSAPADAGPSAQYRQSLEHAGATVTFEPGERVSVPFVPRAGDWPIDSATPQALPAGAESGRAMRRPDADPEPTARLASMSLPQVPTNTTAAPVARGALSREVFGFLPWWKLGSDTTVLDWRALSTVAYFSVGCTGSGDLLKRNPDGSLTTGWAGWTSARMTSVIEAAHRNQTRVVLTLSCFAWSADGAAAQAALLGSPNARTRLARQVAAAVRARGADGVNLDFEPLVAGAADEFTSFVRAVRRELNAVAPGYQLTFDAMGTIGNQPIAAATAPGGADAVLVMAYDYRTEHASVAGSISPLSGPAYDLTDTIRAYTAVVAPSKVILGVPWYGRAWSTPNDDPHAANISGGRNGKVAEPLYEDAAAFLAAYGRRWDPVEQSPWTAYRKRVCTPRHGCVTTWRELYVDDAASLRLRYDLVNESGLRGVGIWALGFDGTRPELRRGLAASFLADRTAPVTAIATLPQRSRDERFRVAWTASDESAIRSFDVQVSTDGGAWRGWLTGVTASSATFDGADGHTYAFRVRATDVHGNASAWPSIPLGTLRTPASITVGGFATVIVDGLRLRAAPSTSADVVTRLRAGDALRVVGGPRVAGGFTWFQVTGPVRQWTPGASMQARGWVAVVGNGYRNAGPRAPVFVIRVGAKATAPGAAAQPRVAWTASGTPGLPTPEAVLAASPTASPTPGRRSRPRTLGRQ